MKEEENVGMDGEDRRGKEERRQYYGEDQGTKKTIIDMSNSLRGSMDIEDITRRKVKEKDKGRIIES